MSFESNFLDLEGKSANFGVVVKVVYIEQSGSVKAGLLGSCKLWLMMRGC